MAIIRTFIAIQIPADIRNKISTFQGELKAVGKGVGWVKPQNIHLTLKFLGETDEKIIDAIEGKIKEAAAGINLFEIKVHGVGAFPNMKRPRVIWIGAECENNVLSTIAGRLDRNLESLGFQSENRKYTAHLTLGRVKDPRNIEPVMEKVESNSNFEAGLFKAEQIELIKSDLLPKGAVYTSLVKVEL